jgi:hypothetical protein
MFCPPDGLPMFLIAGDEAVLCQERNISKPVLLLGLGVIEEGRNIEYELHMALGNELQPFAATKVPGIEVLVVALAHEIRTNFLLKSRRHRDQGCHPTRLSGLCCRHTGLIPIKE